MFIYTYNLINFKTDESLNQKSEGPHIERGGMSFKTFLLSFLAFVLVKDT